MKQSARKTTICLISVIHFSCMGMLFLVSCTGEPQMTMTQYPTLASTPTELSSLTHPVPDGYSHYEHPDFKITFDYPSTWELSTKGWVDGLFVLSLSDRSRPSEIKKWYDSDKGEWVFEIPYHPYLIFHDLIFHEL